MIDEVYLQREDIDLWVFNYDVWRKILVNHGYAAALHYFNTGEKPIDFRD